MIRSMTGYGSAEFAEDGRSYTVELKSLNNRYLKLSIKLPERLQFVEPVVDKMLRKRLARGSVTYTLRTRGQGSTDVGTINASVVQNYLTQISAIKAPSGVNVSVDLGSLMALPGVCESPEMDEETRSRLQGVVEDLTRCGVDALVAMRETEGEALRGDVSNGCRALRDKLAEIETRAPGVVEEYHDRLASRVDTLMKRGGFELETEGLMREVAIYAERCDISEEVMRLGAHLDQFAALCDRREPVGRTMDFLAQELLREANTIASKSNDAAIARGVVEMKSLIDRLKEQVQNVE